MPSKQPVLFDFIARIARYRAETATQLFPTHPLATESSPSNQSVVTATVAVAARPPTPPRPAVAAGPMFPRGDGDGGRCVSAGFEDPIQRDFRIQRAGAYIRNIPGARSGDRGHNATFNVACVFVKGFDLTPAESFSIFAAWNQTCSPPWEESDLRRKLDEADNKPDDQPRGYLFNAVRKAPISPSSTGQPQRCATTATSTVVPISTADVTRRAQEHVNLADLNELYHDAKFHADLVRLEAYSYADFESALNILRQIKGFKERPLARLLQIQRDRIEAEDQTQHREQTADTDFLFTDLANSNRLIARFGVSIKYCGDHKEWMHYDLKKWSFDRENHTQEYAKVTAKSILAECPQNADEDTYKKYHEWCGFSQSLRSVSAMQRLALSDPRIAIRSNEFDGNPLLLNLHNGTLDLERRVFRPHDRNDLIMKISPTSYDINAKCPTFLRFIHEIMDGDQTLIDYLQILFGYSLTGSVKQHILPFLWGTGRNGKNTLLDVIRRNMGDYSVEIDCSLLADSMFSQHPTGLTELQGRRLVVTQELEANQKLAEGLIKKLTGGNQIQARRMGGNFYYFEPMQKIWVAANHKPMVDDMTPAIWSRIKLIPFTVSFDPSIPGSRTPDMELPDKLASEGSGILNWLVEGCYRWMEEGIVDPSRVRNEVDSYRQDMDVLGWFLQAHTINDGSAREEVNALYKVYTAWCTECGSKPNGLRRFSSEMTSRGFKSEQSNSHTFKLGVRLKSQVERQSDANGSNQSALRTAGYEVDWTNREGFDPRDLE